jgi:hypothetical protein
MAPLKKDASSELIKAVRHIEERADECFKALSLLRHPSNIAIWSLLVGGIRRFEQQISQYGDNSPQLQSGLINLSRSLPIAMKWAFDHGRRTSKLASRRWTSNLEAAVEEAIFVALQYSHFLSCFPLWHKNFFAAELVSPTVVRFTLPGSGRIRQVSAYQKGFRPDEGYYKGVRAEKLKQTSRVEALFGQALQNCEKTGAVRFEYDDPWDLWFALLPQYKDRVSDIVRRAESLSLGTFTLREFKQFYSALLSICAAHEYLCFLWGFRHSGYPLDSSLLIRSCHNWALTLSRLSGVSAEKCEAMVRDLMFDFSTSVDLHVHPIVPLDVSTMNLAIAPQFPLHSRPDENILRVCSLLRPSDFDVTSLRKEPELRADLENLGSPYLLQGPIALPHPTPDIDLLLTDETSSTIVISELKWIRKTVRPVERLSRDAEVLKGVGQLEQIRDFLTRHPNYLLSLGKLPRVVNEYANAYYLLVARDHWIWVEPTKELAIVEFEAFSKALRRTEGLHFAMSDLLKYDWLPQEGKNFRVQFDRATVNGVSLESEVYYSL